MQASTLEVLKNFAGINKQILIREGNVIRTQNAEKTIFANAQVDDTFTRGFGVYDLPQMLSAWSLLQDPVVTYEDDHILLEKSGAEIKYYYSLERHIKAATDREMAVPPAILKFEMKKEILAEMLKASSVLKLTNLYISSQEVVCRNPDGTGNEYKCPISDIEVSEDAEIDTDDEYDEFDINIDALRLIPDDYDVTLTEICLVFKAKNRALEYFILLNN